MMEQFHFGSSADEKIFTLGKYKDEEGTEHTKLAGKFQSIT